jgi:hypothetical protein
LPRVGCQRLVMHADEDRGTNGSCGFGCTFDATAIRRIHRIDPPPLESPPMNPLSSSLRATPRRLAGGAALALLTVVLTACGGGSDSTPPAATTPTTPTSPTTPDTTVKPEMRCAP